MKRFCKLLSDEMVEFLADTRGLIMKKVYILGIGPGHKDYLLKITEDTIARSDVLIGGKRALKIFADIEKEKIIITADLKKLKIIYWRIIKRNRFQLLFLVIQAYTV
jgi:uncharacterized Rossmann fold enzyme